MSYKSYDSVYDNVTIPDTANGSNSRSFSVPKGAKTVSIHAPDLTGAATTLKIQGLKPRPDDQAAETWVDKSATVITGTSPTFCALSLIPESAVTVIPVTALGGGINRFVASAAQGATVDAFTIVVEWGFDG